MALGEANSTASPRTCVSNCPSDGLPFKLMPKLPSVLAIGSRELYETDATFPPPKS